MSVADLSDLIAADPNSRTLGHLELAERLLEHCGADEQRSPGLVSL